jgi:hypothetical protein
VIKKDVHGVEAVGDAVRHAKGAACENFNGQMVSVKDVGMTIKSVSRSFDHLRCLMPAGKASGSEVVMIVYKARDVATDR